MMDTFIGRLLILWLDRITTSLAHYDAVRMGGVHLITTGSDSRSRIEGRLWRAGLDRQRMPLVALNLGLDHILDHSVFLNQ